MIVNVGLRRFPRSKIAQLLASATFNFTPRDAGAGVATITLDRGTGSAAYTRATPAWTKLITGNWGSVASGSPRYCYTGQNTVAGTAGQGGYLSEAAGTQLVTPTAAIRDMTDAAWVKVNVTPAKTATGISGVANSATTLTATANGGTCLLTLVAAATTRTYSLFIRRKTGTGTITIQQGATTLDVTALLNSTTYTRVQLPASVLNAAYGVVFGTNGDAIEVDFNQFEAGNLATSPMDAAGAVRNADSLTYVGSGNVDPAQGTCYAELSTFLPTGQTASVPKEAVGTSNGGLMLRLGTGLSVTAIQINDGTNSALKSSITDMFTGIRKRAGSWGAGGIFVTGDGENPATAAFDGAMGDGVTIGIGNTGAGVGQWNGGIKNVRIWLNQFPDSTLQALTL